MNLSSNSPILYSQLVGEQVLDPTDKQLQKRVQGSFWVKLQRDEVADPESKYRLLAIAVLSQAKEKGYSENDMEDACRRFERTTQFGERIEIAHFFESEPETLLSYQHIQRLHAEGKAQWNEFDGYLIEDGKPLRWRKHDGKRLDKLKLVIWEGKHIEPPKKTESPKLPGRNEPDDAMKLLSKLALENMDLKIKNNDLSKRVERAEDEVEYFKKALSKHTKWKAKQCPVK